MFRAWRCGFLGSGGCLLGVGRVEWFRVGSPVVCGCVGVLLLAFVSCCVPGGRVLL